MHTKTTPSIGKLVQILVPRFRCLDEEMNKRTQFEHLPLAERNEIRLLRLNETWRNATQGSRYYAGLSQRLKLPDKFSSFEEFRTTVPRTTKAAVRTRTGCVQNTRSATRQVDADRRFHGFSYQGLLEIRGSSGKFERSILGPVLVGRGAF